MTMLGSQRQKLPAKNWFAKRKNRFVRQVIDDFFCFVLSFRELYGLYLSCLNDSSGACSDFTKQETQNTRAQMWDQLTRMVGTESDKGPLWNLKNTCHLVWPEDDIQPNVKGSLVDWLVGSIFHEAMKLKENIYLLNAYGPAAVRIGQHPKEQTPHTSASSPVAKELTLVIDVQNLLDRIAEDVVSQMDQICSLMGQANYIFRVMMPELSGNTLVVRYLVEQKNMLESIWGESLQSLFADMFDGNPANGFLVAGRSYLDGQWYEKALAMYDRALELEPGNDTALVKTAQLRPIVVENKKGKKQASKKSLAAFS